MLAIRKTCGDRVARADAVEGRREIGIRIVEGDSGSGREGREIGEQVSESSGSRAGDEEDRDQERRRLRPRLDRVSACVSISRVFNSGPRTTSDWGRATPPCRKHPSAIFVHRKPLTSRAKKKVFSESSTERTGTLVPSSSARPPILFAPFHRGPRVSRVSLELSNFCKRTALFAVLSSQYATATIELQTFLRHGISVEFAFPMYYAKFVLAEKFVIYHHRRLFLISTHETIVYLP